MAPNPQPSKIKRQKKIMRPKGAQNARDKKVACNQTKESVLFLCVVEQAWESVADMKICMSNLR